MHCNFFVSVSQITYTRFSLSARVYYPLLYRVPDIARSCFTRHATTPTCYTLARENIHLSKFTVAMALAPRMCAPSTFSRRLLVRRDSPPQCGCSCSLAGRLCLSACPHVLSHIDKGLSIVSTLRAACSLSLLATLRVFGFRIPKTN